MLRSVSCFVVGMFLVSWASAQNAKGPEDTGPKGEAKLRWVCQRLELTDIQRQQMEAEIETYKAEMAEAEQNAQQIMEQVRDKYGEIQDAKAKGDMELVKRLEKELRDLAPAAAAERHFFERLSQVLTDEQKAKLPALQEQVRTAKDEPATIGAPLPYRALGVALELKLTLEQHRHLEKVLDDFRKKQSADRPKDQATAKARFDDLAQSIRGILTPEQAAQFDKKVAALRG